MSYFTGAKPYKNRMDAPPVSIYLLSGDAPELDQLNCMFCKRTIADIKGRIDKVISTPMPLVDFDIATNVRCKLCRQDYRLLVNVR